MNLSAKELKAINWYYQDRSLKLVVSTPPIMYFKNQDGKEVRVDLSEILNDYNQWNEQDKKERAREKRAAIAQENSVRRVI